jgi:hypothetical protein
MKLILAKFLRAHHHHEAWWFKLKTTRKADSSTSSPPDGSPGEYCLSDLLGICMDDLWKVLIACDLATKRGKRGNVLNKNAIDEFITAHELTDVVILDEKDKLPVLRIGVYTQNSTPSDHCSKKQWKSNKRPPPPLRDASKEFRHEFSAFMSQNKEARSETSVVTVPVLDKNLENLPDLPDADDAASPSSESEKAIRASVLGVNSFFETINPKDYPTLSALNICLKTDRDIKAVIRDLIKLSKKVKSVDLLKVLNYNDSTTSLVEVPCSARQSGFKKQARRSRWVHRILQCVRKYKEGLVADDETREDEDDEFAYTDDDAARWLITYLGDYYPSEFVKSAQALDMPIHQGKMDAEYTTAMWSDAGVGVAAQRIVMKYFIDFFGYKFTVAESQINQLAVESVPPVVGTVQYMDHTLDYWYKDLEILLTGQIAKEHNNQPAFSYTSVDFVIGADHGQGSFRAGVKVIFRNDDGSIQATAIYGLGEIECQKDTAELLALAFTPKLNAALRRIVKYERDPNGNLLSDGSLAI